MMEEKGKGGRGGSGCRNAVFNAVWRFNLLIYFFFLDPNALCNYATREEDGQGIKNRASLIVHQHS